MTKPVPVYFTSHAGVRLRIDQMVAGSGHKYRLSEVDNQVEAVRTGGKDGLRHLVDVPSVTTLLNRVIAKPGLTNWARTEAIEGVDAALDKLSAAGQPFAIGSTGASLVEAHKRHLIYSAAKEIAEAKQQSRIDHGTGIHNAISSWALGEEAEGDNAIKYRGHVLAIQQWLADNQYDISDAEGIAYNEADGYAGCFDLLLEHPTADGTRYAIADIKATNGVYPEMAFQLAAYASALYSMFGISVDELLVLHFPSDPDAPPEITEYAVDAWDSADLAASSNLVHDTGALLEAAQLMGGWAPFTKKEVA
jgi:hypothetical protein